jgi:hypothetical protein
MLLGRYLIAKSFDRGNGCHNVMGTRGIKEKAKIFPFMKDGTRIFIAF